MEQQTPWTLDGLDVPPSSDCSLLKGLMSEMVIGSGRDGVVVIVHRLNERGMSSGEKFVLKITAMRHQHGDRPTYHIAETAAQAAPPDRPAPRDFRRDALHTIQNLEPWQLPVVKYSGPLLELHNWSVAQYVLDGRNTVRNLARLYGWQRCRWTHQTSNRLAPPPSAMALQKVDSREAALLNLPTPETVKMRAQELTYMLYSIRHRKQHGTEPLARNVFNDYDSVVLDVEVLLLEYVPSGPLKIRSLDASGLRLSNFEHYLSAKRFFDIWTQLVCTVSFLSKRARFSHGDLHPSNVMLTPIAEAFPPAGDHRPVVLIYDVPIVDQRGRVFDWRFFVFQPMYVARIIDLGFSRTRVEFPDDLERLAPVDGRTWAAEWPDFYVQRGDAFSFALGAFHELSKLLPSVHYNPEANDRLPHEVYPIGCALLHAMERRPYDNQLRLLTRALSPVWRVDNLRTSHGVKQLRATLQELTERQRKISYNCIEQKERTEECPELIVPPPPEHDAGRWTLDEHLVLFSPEFNGYPRATNFEPYSRMPSSRVQDVTHHPERYRIIEMLPGDDRRPPEFPRERPAAGSSPYPVFRCFEAGNAQINEPIARYRTELAAAVAQAL